MKVTYNHHLLLFSSGLFSTMRNFFPLICSYMRNATWVSLFPSISWASAFPNPSLFLDGVTATTSSPAALPIFSLPSQSSLCTVRVCFWKWNSHSVNPWLKSYSFILHKTVFPFLIKAWRWFCANSFLSFFILSDTLPLCSRWTTLLGVLQIYQCILTVESLHFLYLVYHPGFWMHPIPLIPLQENAHWSFQAHLFCEILLCLVPWGTPSSHHALLPW